MSCGVGCRGGSDPKLLRLWCRPAAIALIRPLAWELPCASGKAIKRKKKLVFDNLVYHVCSYFFLFFLELHLQHMEVPRLGVESKLQLPPYTTATAMQDLSHVCDLHYSSQQCQILNPLSKERD